MSNAGHPSRRGFLGLATALAATPLLAACAGGSADSGSGSATLTLAAFGSGTSLDPWKAHVSPWCEQALYDTLTHLDEDGNAIPWLATSWKYTDPKTLDVKLRSGVTFADGTAFDASVVKANLEYGKAATPKNFGSGPYVNVIESVTVVDPHTARIKLSEPNPDLPYAFSQQAGWMAHPDGLKNPDSLKLGGNGTGPYRLDKSRTVSGQTYTFIKNQDYWADAEFKRFDTLVLKVVTEQKSAENAAAAGTIDLLIATPTTDISGYKVGAGAAVTLEGFYIADVRGQLVAALGDKRVRQAMNYAIDREAVLKQVLKGAGVVNGSSTPFGADSDGWTKALDATYSYDVAKAKKLLKEAGYAGGFKAKVLSTSQYDTIAQAMAGYLREVGIDLEISNRGTDFTEQAATGDWPLVMSLSQSVGEPYSDVTANLTKAALNNGRGNTDPKIENLLTKAATAGSEKEATAFYLELAQYAADQAWMVAPALITTLFAYNPKKLSVRFARHENAPAVYDFQPAN